MVAGSLPAVPRAMQRSDLDTSRLCLVAVNPSMSVLLASAFLARRTLAVCVVLARGSDGFSISTRQALNVGAPFLRASTCEAFSPTLTRFELDTDNGKL